MPKKYVFLIIGNKHLKKRKDILNGWRPANI